MVKLSLDVFLIRCKEKHGDKYDYSLVEYINSNTKVKIICPEHGVFEQIAKHHMNGCGCIKCKGLKKLSTNDFIKKCEKIHGDKYDYSLVEYINSSTKVKIICPEHDVFEQRPNDHLSKSCGCRKCLSYKINDFINIGEEIHGDKYDYSLVEYNNNKDKVKIICPEHGVFEQTVNSHIKYGSGCPICKTSKGEKYIRNFLDGSNILYIEQHRFNDCKDIRPLPFDFYLPEHNTCIEYDGIQHFKAIPYWGGKKGLEGIKRRDNIKNEYCLENGIKLIRVDYKLRHNVTDLNRLINE